ncbi:MAG: hypothetical protein GTO12_10560 [Proteobacteria bacterium]|nr:hypothetical protein [Pseudomonadota bacterium]
MINSSVNWFEHEVKPRLKTKATLIRFADDFLICFEHRQDAERVKAVLGKRLGRHRLSLQPDKTRLVDFRRLPWSQTCGKGPGIFHFLEFTVYWCRNHRGRG